LQLYSGTVVSEFFGSPILTETAYFRKQSIGFLVDSLKKKLNGRAVQSLAGGRTNGNEAETFAYASLRYSFTSR
jgi:hypothetical protein